MKYLMCLILLTGCGAARQMEAWEDLSKSKAAYKECLESARSTPSKCAALKEAYEADARTYDSTTPKIGGFNNTTTVNNK